MHPAIQVSLQEGEEVLWQGKKNLAASLVVSIVGMVLPFLIGGFLLLLGSGEGTCTVNGEVQPTADCTGFLSLIGNAMFFLGLVTPLSAYISYRVTEYMITSKRIMIKTGLIGADIRSIFHEQIKSVAVNVGVIGKIFGTGTILLDTGSSVVVSTRRGTETVSSQDKLVNIDAPYEVSRILDEKIASRKEGLYAGTTGS